MEPKDIIRIELPARYRYLNVIGATVRAVLERVESTNLAKDQIYQIQLAIHEVCNNVIEHAYGDEEGQLQVQLTIPSATQPFVVELFDSGVPFDPATLAPQALTEPRVAGYGLFLAHQLLDEVTYQRTAETNHWRLVKVL
ncbi:MAG: ATP-binding protein [Caldilineaceae bacterium]|nr:ATP-binding protein [Caldilineaceae bacterium]